MYSSPLHKEITPDHGTNVVKMERGTLDLGSREVDQFDVSRNGDGQFMEQDRSNGPSVNSRENEKDARNFETSGSDSSPTRGKTPIDRMDVDYIKGGNYDEAAEEEKVDAIHSDEKQQRKHKRTVMNDKQIALIESALVDEPVMHRNAISLRSWADKLSIHGAEVTTSRLKNWLNNRKAKLARAAKDVSLERLGSSGHLDSPRSSMDDARVSLAARGSVENEATNIEVTASVDEEDMGTSRRNNPARTLSFEPGQYVMLVDERGNEVGKGSVVQVDGNWCGDNLDQSGTCVVDIKELSIDRFSNVLRPLEACNSFYQAEKRFGSMRVLWDLSKLSLYLEPGEYVILVGERGQEIGRGTVFQSRGHWCGEELGQSGICLVDIKELLIDRFADLPHPVEATGTSFYQAEKRVGVMRVLWDSDKLSRLQPR